MIFSRFLHSSHFYYWLSAVFFSFYYLLESGFPAFLFFCGSFSLFYGVILFLSIDPLGVAVKGLVKKEVEEIFPSCEKLRKESSLNRKNLNPGTPE